MLTLSNKTIVLIINTEAVVVEVDSIVEEEDEANTITRGRREMHQGLHAIDVIS